MADCNHSPTQRVACAACCQIFERRSLAAESALASARARIIALELDAELNGYEHDADFDSKEEAWTKYHESQDVLKAARSCLERGGDMAASHALECIVRALSSTPAPVAATLCSHCEMRGDHEHRCPLAPVPAPHVIPLEDPSLWPFDVPRAAPVAAPDYEASVHKSTGIVRAATAARCVDGNGQYIVGGVRPVAAPCAGCARRENQLRKADEAHTEMRAEISALEKAIRAAVNDLEAYENWPETHFPARALSALRAARGSKP